jgi:hypothetical protein
MATSTARARTKGATGVVVAVLKSAAFRRVERNDVRPRETAPLQFPRKLRDYVPSPCGRRSLERFRERDFDDLRWAKRWPNALRIYAVSRPVFALRKIVTRRFLEKLRDRLARGRFKSYPRNY